jgi:protein-disulfide isomerase/uncharacterized membrane protein
MPRTWRIVLAIVLILSGAALAGVLWLEHHGESAASAVVRPICGQEATSGCETVKRSSYSQIAGWPSAAVGVFYYGSLLLLLSLVLLADKTLRPRGLALALLLCAAGVVVDLFLLGIQAFALHAFCTLCLLSYIGSVGGLILLLPARRALSALLRSPLADGGRLLLGAWAAGSLILLAGVAATELALDDREVLADPARAQEYFLNQAVRKFQHAPVLAPDLTGAPMLGARNAPLRVVVYSDFLCPWCREFAGFLIQYLPRVQEQLSVSFKHYPLDQTCNPALARTLHPGSCAMALGGVCAAEQGRFWPYHESAFGAALEKAGRSEAVNAARQSGLDLPSFERCLDSDAAAQHLARDIAEAHALGVTGTPTVVLNGKQIDRAGDLPLMVQVESARLGLARQPETKR